VGEPTSQADRLEVIGQVGRYRWPSERSDVPKGVCPVCEQLITRVLSCSCSRQAFFGRAALGSILRGPE
jgi:hypothetical protein